MTDRSHLRFGEDPYALDDLTVERLVRGLPPEDAPPRYREAASALAALRASSAPEELAGEAEMVAAMAAVISPGPTYPRRSRMLTKFLTAKAAAAVAAGVVSLSGVAAAATGTLPGPLQQAVANLAAPVVSLPGATPSVDPSTTTTTAVPETTTTVADTPTSAPIVGTGETTTTTSVVPGSAAACAGATTHGEYVSGVARDHSTTGRDHGKAVSTAAKSDCGKSDQSTTTSIPSTTETTNTTETTVTPAATDGHTGDSPSTAPEQSHRPSTTPTSVDPSSDSHGKGNRPATTHGDN